MLSMVENIFVLILNIARLSVRIVLLLLLLLLFLMDKGKCI